MTEDERNEAEWSNAANWRYGVFYFSKVDTRPWVPKRSMFGRRRYGGTPNFAHPGARAFLMLVVGLAVGLVLLISALERSGLLP